MNKKKIDKLVAISYKDKYLDKKIVNKIASVISKADLKRYINGLRLAEKKRSLIVSSPIIDSDLNKFRKLFPHKKIVFKRDPSLILGTQVIDNDIVYDFTLKNSIDKILNHIEQNYD